MDQGWGKGGWDMDWGTAARSRIRLCLRLRDRRRRPDRRVGRVSPYPGGVVKWSFTFATLLACDVVVVSVGQVVW